MKVYSGKATGPGISRNENNKNGNLKIIELKLIRSMPCCP